MFLAAAMTVSITTSVSAAGETETTEHIKLTDKIFNTTVVSENNGVTSTYGLNNEPTYTVNLELTDGTEEIEYFTITDTEGQSISSQLSNTNNSVQISGLVLDELYIFNSTVDGTPIRGAVETLMDGDTVVAVTDVYDFLELESAANNNVASPRSNGSAYLVTEGDDSTSSRVLAINKTMILRGTVHAAYDYDYYRFTADKSGIVDVKLLVPDIQGLNLVLFVGRYGSEGALEYQNVNNLHTSDEFFRIENVLEGEVLIIVVYDPGRIVETYKRIPLSTYMSLGSQNNNYTYSSISLMYYYS